MSPESMKHSPVAVTHERFVEAGGVWAHGFTTGTQSRFPDSKGYVAVETTVEDFESTIRQKGFEIEIKQTFPNGTKLLFLRDMSNTRNIGVIEDPELGLCVLDVHEAIFMNTFT